MRQGADSPRELSHTLPHTLLSSCLPVYLRGHLVADAAMRALLVVETDEAGYAVTGILLALESMLAVNDLGLKDTVHTLGYGIVRRLVIFCHADSYFVFKKFFRIGIATVLYTSVRVVDEVVQFFFRSLFHCHLERKERVLCLQRIRQAPADYLVRIGIRDKVQIAASVHEIYVCYVADP